ncbi:MAG: hypothetical protein CFE44_12620 [Burkholderiales bacterium PBB4]|nr:MAG: hypothetical protein CFE44_12620 [Burkholderiales bacterium PBB4]
MHWIALQARPEAALPDALADVPTALAWWALQFTPLVARVDEAVVMDISGSARLFGGQHALEDRIFRQKKPFEPVDSAGGTTSLIALGRLWTGRPHSPVDELPLSGLAVARPHLPTLVRVGCRTWGDVRALPRAGVARRFGASLVDALDRAYGRAPEVYPWMTLPEVFDAPLELLASVDAAPALMFGARRLLAQFKLWLQMRQRGAVAWELLWELDARRSNAQHRDAHHDGGPWGRLSLRTAQPTQDMQHLQRLMAEQLDRVTLPAPVLHLRLRSVHTEPMAGETFSLLPEDMRKGDSLQHLLERLGARLGPQQVLRPRLVADHRPQCMQQWEPAERSFAMNSGAAPALSMGQNAKMTETSAPPATLLPTWLLATPQRLVVQQGRAHYLGPLDLLVGPQRLEAGWLEEGEGGASLRDYYVARSPTAGLLWVFRDRLAGPEVAHWYLHGMFA